ncbi:MAG: biopolymer transporter ExbD [Deltaproteobacteria bacterium]|nr:biopolymer transporter ExbD [Deltaproteobacteria bacterium]|tara:strand:- start:581 stop:1021 length:441 start_codon:yes stop_codon:yes gene_type:complete
MAGGASMDDDDIIVAINVTPLVDVVLVLLIIFMVTARLMVPPAIPLELPKASTGEESKTSPISITIRKAEKNRKETFYLNGKLVTTEQLKERVKQLAKKQGKNAQAIIAADRIVIHGKIIWLLDLLRRLGVEQYAFNIDPDQADAP